MFSETSAAGPPHPTPTTESAVSANLDFSNARLRRLFADANRPMITREEGLHELR